MERRRVTLPLGKSEPWNDFTEVEWRQICDATKIYQDTTGSVIVSGEPWEAPLNQTRPHPHEQAETTNPMEGNGSQWTDSLAGRSPPKSPAVVEEMTDFLAADPHPHEQ